MASKPNKLVLGAGMVLVVPLLVLFAVSFGRDPHEVDSPLVGRPAPLFALAAVQDGQVASLAELKGKPIILNFWATWCVPCADEHPVLQMAARRFGDSVRFLGVVYDDEPDRIREYLKKHGGAYPTLVDDGGKTAIAYGVYGVPETFFIDASGKIVAKHNGPLDARLIERYLRMANESKPATAATGGAR